MNGCPVLHLDDAGWIKCVVFTWKAEESVDCKYVPPDVVSWVVTAETKWGTQERQHVNIRSRFRKAFRAQGRRIVRWRLDSRLLGCRGGPREAILCMNTFLCMALDLSVGVSVMKHVLCVRWCLCLSVVITKAYSVVKQELWADLFVSTKSETALSAERRDPKDFPRVFASLLPTI